MSLLGIIIKKVSYIFIYVSYESQVHNRVFFDDLTVTHHQSPVVQSNNYYPFGLQHATSWTRSTTVKNNRLYNAGSEFNEQTKNYETFYRNYDPAIGRFTAIDIMAGKYTSITPYQYAFNDPIAFNDPLGDDPSSSSYVGAYEMMMRGNSSRGDGYLASLLHNGGGRHSSNVQMREDARNMSAYNYGQNYNDPTVQVQIGYWVKYTEGEYGGYEDMDINGESYRIFNNDITIGNKFVIVAQNDQNGGNDPPWSISFTLSGALAGDGIGYTIGYFSGSNSRGLYVTKMIADVKKTNLSLGLTIDISDYNALTKSGTVEFGDIMGRGAEVAGSIGPIGVSYAEPVPHFISASYNGFIPTYSINQVSGGIGFPIGYTVWNSYTTPLFK